MFHLLQTVKREITELFFNCLELTQPTLAMRNIATDIYGMSDRSFLRASFSRWRLFFKALITTLKPYPKPTLNQACVPIEPATLNLT